MKHYLLLLAAILSVSLAACSSEEAVGPVDDEDEKDFTPPTSIQLSRAEADIVDAQNTTSIKLFKTILDDEGYDKNICISPLSIEMVMSMLANGANQEILNNTLDFFGVNSINEINDFNKRLLTELPQVKPNKVTIAFNNGLWTNSMFTINNEFKSMLASNYNVDLFDIDFSKSDVKDMVNSWSSDKTNGMIPTIIENKVQQNLPIVLANSVYINAKFDKIFNKDLTQPEDFYDSYNNLQGKVDMMYNDDTYWVVRHDAFDAVRLTYGNGGFEFWVLLPSAGSTPEQTIQTLDSEGIQCLERRLEYTVKLKMPRFKYSTSLNLASTLQTLGLEYSAATLGNISNASNFNLTLLHGTNIETTEEGVKIAAVTSSDEFYHNAEPPRISLTFNRPFVYIIREASTGIILFTGIFKN